MGKIIENNPSSSSGSMWKIALEGRKRKVTWISIERIKNELQLKKGK